MPGNGLLQPSGHTLRKRTKLDGAPDPSKALRMLAAEFPLGALVTAYNRNS